jgi:hypothetical protein
MKEYIIPMILYAVSAPVSNYFIGYGYLAKIILTFIALAYFWKYYKEIKIRFDASAILIGVIIFLVWIGLEPLYGVKETSFIPTAFNILARIFGGVFVASIIEELFTRSFLMRFFIDFKNWKKVPIGRYTLASFIITVLFFGLAHKRWIAGIVVGIILNLYLYKKKDIFSCIQAHAWSNLILAVYIIITSSWFFW